MTKNDLRDGMVIVTKNKRQYMVYGDRLLRTSGAVPLEAYKDDLTHNTNDEFTIILVFDKNDCTSCTNITHLCEPCGNLLWKRPSIF